MEKRVLIVDDEAPVRELFAMYFRVAGYDAVVAGSGKEALEILRDNNIQIMFLDLRMPEMDGIELCRRIRERNQVACIYAVTGYSTLFELSDCREAGFDDYFAKPVEPEHLVKIAEDSLEKLRRWTSE